MTLLTLAGSKSLVTMSQPNFSCNKLKEKESGEQTQMERMKNGQEEYEKEKSERVREEISPKSNLTF